MTSKIGIPPLHYTYQNPEEGAPALQVGKFSGLTLKRAVTTDSPASIRGLTRNVFLTNSWRALAHGSAVPCFDIYR